MSSYVKFDDSKNVIICYNVKKVHFLKVIKYFCLFFVNWMSTIYITKDMAWLRVDVISLNFKKSSQLHIFDLAKWKLCDVNNIYIYIYTIYWYKAWICPRKSRVLSNMFDLKSWEITQLRFYSKCISQKIKILWSQWSRKFYLAVYKTFFVTGGLFWISCISLIMLYVNNHFFMF